MLRKETMIPALIVVIGIESVVLFLLVLYDLENRALYKYSGE